MLIIPVNTCIHVHQEKPQNNKQLIIIIMPPAIAKKKIEVQKSHNSSKIRQIKMAANNHTKSEPKSDTGISMSTSA